MMKLKLATLIVGILAMVVVAAAQENIGVDWATKKLISYPPEIDKTTAVKIVVSNANDLLYDYTPELTGTPRATSDAEQLFSLGSTARMAAGAPCPVNSQVATDLVTALGMYPFDPTKTQDNQPSKVPISIPLADTLKGWQTSIAQHINDVSSILANPVACANALNILAPIMKSLNRMKQFLDSTHEITKFDYLRIDTDYTLVVTEKFGNTTTAIGPQSFSFSPQSNAVTLSVGTLITTLENRSYAATSVPSVSSPGSTQSVLVTSGRGPRPVGVALLNYELWRGTGMWSDMGLTVSSGVEIQGSGKSDVTPVGYFGGISAYLFHRLFITPGVHVGQFADYPAGFTDNQVIPPNFGTPVPVKRWTARFGISITYKATSLGSAKVKASTPAPAKAGAGGAD